MSPLVLCVFTCTVEHKIQSQQQALKSSIQDSVKQSQQAGDEHEEADGNFRDAREAFVAKMKVMDEQNERLEQSYKLDMDKMQSEIDALQQQMVKRKENMVKKQQKARNNVRR